MSITNEDVYKLLQNVNKEIKQEIKDLRNDVAKELDFLKTKIQNLEQENSVLKNKLVYIERKQKKYNIVVYGIEETSEKVEDILTTLNEKLDLQLNLNEIRDTYRIGKKHDGKIRPLILETVNYHRKQDILNKAKIRQSELKSHKIFFSLDYAEEDYKKRKFLREHLKAARAKHYKATIKNNILIVNGEEYTYEYLISNKQIEFEITGKSHSAPATPTIESTQFQEHLQLVEVEKDDKKRKTEETPTKPTGTKPKINTRAQFKLKLSNN